MSSGDMVKPFLRWLGGKSRLMDKIIDLTPKTINNYYEPFLGSGSVLLNILYMNHTKRINIKGNIVASDINNDLINLFIDVRDNLYTLINEITIFSNEYSAFDRDDDREQYYYKIRDRYNKMECSTQTKSAMFVFLNKTCFRGMYRCSKKTGYFNVPFGNYKTVTLIPKNMEFISQLIQPVIFNSMDFSMLNMSMFSGDDFLYLDPPYMKVNSHSFVSYTADGFNIEQYNLLLSRLTTSTDAQFMLSNSYVDEIMENFSDPKYTIYIYPINRKINSKDPTQKSKEVLIINYTLNY